jgi:hypothetical protein
MIGRASNGGQPPIPEVVSGVFRTLIGAERRPALAQAVIAPLICWRLLDHAVPTIWRNLAATRLSADCPSGNEPTWSRLKGL